MKTFSFEKLSVWQKSRKLAVKTYKLTKLFPDDERFGLISQMRRCAVSISSNIAEGTGRHSAKDKARFTEIAFSSALELLNQIIISNDLELLSNEAYKNVRQDISEITAMLDGLYKSK
ncbi:four helix bundle protein [Flavivirga aquimarina]|uniref:Four helix bundle protein n=1 Tax=Flavivirga aquimarina TaxID=2027862 RepID=A0ABT8WH88_9FLAO|nr:four helix bundle protein [Flavivirga aquimarina]MDO5972523.1 four helix bundle protein [Flavivirga aquimarina]